MKKLIFVLSMFACFIVLQAQNSVMPKTEVIKDTAVLVNETATYTTPATVETPIQDIEKTIVDHFVDAIYLFFDYINWLYLVVFILLTWLVGDFSRATNTAQWLNWISKIPKLLLAFGIGLLLIVVFYYLFGYSGKQDVISCLFSLLSALIIYKIGIDRFLKWLSGKLGLKFGTDEKTADKPVPPTA